MNKSEQGLAVLDWIERSGLKVSPSSRVGEMVNLFAKRDGSLPPEITPDHPKFDVACEAQRDIQMLSFASKQLGEIPTTGLFKQRIKRMLKDPVLPQDDVVNSPGRDYQCEMYVESICKKARLEPIYAEPDIVCTFRGKKYAIAVKRCKSIGSFENRIREAARQIGHAKLPGIIVADISVMMNPKNERIVKPVADADFKAAAILMMRDFVAHYQSPLKKMVDGQGVGGFIFFDHHVRLNPDSGWGLETITKGVCLRGFESVIRQFLDGLATPAIR